MNTIFTCGVLIISGLIIKFLGVFILNIAGVPGALISGKPEKRSKAQFIIGSIISAIGQLYVYLAYIAFIVSYTSIAANRDDVVSFLVWPSAFISILFPIWFMLIRARVEAREMKHASAQTEALHLTLLGSIIGFFLFIFIPEIPETIWVWVPYVKM